MTTIRRHPLALFVLGILAVVGFAVHRAVTLTTSAGIDLSGVPSVAWGFLAGFFLAGRILIRAGRYVQAYDHSRRGVLRGHLGLIRGKH